MGGRALYLFVAALLVAATAGEVDAGLNVVEVDVPDVELRNQEGNEGRFVSDYIADNIAAITFTFTSCRTVCPRLNGIFKQLQEKVAEDLGRDVALLTVSIDPETDVPEKLERHAALFDARPGWEFLTGERETVTRLLKSLEVYAPDIRDHPPAVFVVDGSRDTWSRLHGFPSAGAIAAAIDEYRDARASR